MASVDWIEHIPLEHLLAMVDPQTLRALECTSHHMYAAVTGAVRSLVLQSLPRSQHSLTKHGVSWRDLYRSLHTSQFGSHLRWSRGPSLDRPRFAHSTVVYKSLVVVFGGRHGPQYMNDVATLCLKTCQWLPDKTTGSRPSPKRAHTAVVQGASMYVLGGGSDTLPGTGELHALELEALTWRELTSPPGWSFLGHTCVAAPDDRLVVFGGCWWGDEFKVTDDLREYNITKDSWATPEVVGTRPCARYRHSMCQLRTGGGHTCVMYGGYVATWRDGCQRSPREWCYNRKDMHTLDTRTYTWSAVDLNAGVDPLPRGAHSCCVLGDNRLLFFGGGILYFDGSEHVETDCSELFVVDTKRWTYEFVYPRRAGDSGRGEEPSARGSHGAVVVACEGNVGMLLLGGRNYNKSGSQEFEIHRGRDDGWMLTFDPALAAAPAREATAAGS